MYRGTPQQQPQPSAAEQRNLQRNSAFSDVFGRPSRQPQLQQHHQPNQQHLNRTYTQPQPQPQPYAPPFPPGHVPYPPGQQYGQQPGVRRAATGMSYSQRPQSATDYPDSIAGVGTAHGQAHRAGHFDSHQSPVLHQSPLVGGYDPYTLTTTATQPFSPAQSYKSPQPHSTGFTQSHNSRPSADSLYSQSEFGQLAGVAAYTTSGPSTASTSTNQNRQSISSINSTHQSQHHTNPAYPAYPYSALAHHHNPAPAHPPSAYSSPNPGPSPARSTTSLPYIAPTAPIPPRLPEISSGEHDFFGFESAATDPGFGLSQLSLDHTGSTTDASAFGITSGSAAGSVSSRRNSPPTLYDNGAQYEVDGFDSSRRLSTYRE